MAKKKSDTRVQRLRAIILVSIAVIVTALFAYGVFYSSGAGEGEFTAGEHYRVIRENVRQREGAPIEVVEYFSYGCIHCRNFDPLIEDWVEDMPEGVRFRRQPVAFSPIWELLGRTYIALETMGALDAHHERIFRAVHDQQKQFLTPEMMADFVDGRGTTREDFLSAFNSPEVRRRAAEMKAASNRNGVTSVPTLVVADKYMVNMNVGRKVALDVVDHLIALEQNPQSPAP